jgi:nicotinate-nucleotide pyrophosphorylase (carboxylating)
MADALRRALAEDRAEDDITTRWAVPDGTHAHARVVACQDGVIAGTAIPAEVYRQLGSDVVVTERVQDGDSSTPGGTCSRWQDPHERSSPASGQL